MSSEKVQLLDALSKLGMGSIALLILGYMTIENRRESQYLGELYHGAMNRQIELLEEMAENQKLFIEVLKDKK